MPISLSQPSESRRRVREANRIGRSNIDFGGLQKNAKMDEIIEKINEMYSLKAQLEEYFSVDFSPPAKKPSTGSGSSSPPPPPPQPSLVVGTRVANRMTQSTIRGTLGSVDSDGIMQFASGEVSTKRPAHFVFMQSVPTGELVEIVHAGEVELLVGSDATVVPGSPVYLGADTAKLGWVTSTRPSGTDYVQRIGWWSGSLNQATGYAKANVFMSDPFMRAF